MSALQHRLAAILAADAAGYSRLMSIDDKATVAALDAIWRFICDILAARIVVRVLRLGNRREVYR